MQNALNGPAQRGGTAAREPAEPLTRRGEAMPGEGSMSCDENKEVVRRYYHELWNRWRFELADELLEPALEFRGSLGASARGVDGFLEYMGIVRAAFPDFENRIDDLIAEGDRVVARLTYAGTHRGEVFGIGPTGRRITYAGVAIFTFRNGRIVSGWVLGDIDALRRQLRDDGASI